MPDQNLFNSAGEWLGFRIGSNVFNTASAWVGWVPPGTDEVVTPDGEYLGTITDGDRLYYFLERTLRAFPPSPGFPGYPGYFGYPGPAEPEPLPPSARDVELKRGPDE